MTRCILMDGTLTNDKLMSCPYCIMDSGGNHEYFCPLNGDGFAVPPEADNTGEIIFVVRLEDS